MSTSTSAPLPRERIPGWGADLDTRMRPAHPRERHPPRLPEHAQRMPAQQVQDVEVLHSTEREAITPVFGSTVPPSGLSGGLRRCAFGFSENDLRHWLLLLLADRVQVIEGLGQDLAAGHVPNLWTEMGWQAEWRYNRPALVRRLLVASALAGLACMLYRTRRHAPRALPMPPQRRP